jgi:DNA-directed RNA polymerase specialized sigma24 family protein
LPDDDPFDPLSPAGEAILRRMIGAQVRRFRFEPDYAEDLYQEAVTRWVARGQQPRPRAWFLRVTANLLLSRVRRSETKTTVADPVDAPNLAGALGDSARSDRLAGLVSALNLEGEVIGNQLIERHFAAIRQALAELEQRSPDQYLAAVARWRERILEEEGESGLAGVEEVLGCSFSGATGTAELARQRNLKPGTVASHATRGVAWLLGRIAELRR